MADENQQPNAERKTFDDHQKMTDLERLRHSAAHVMASAFVTSRYVRIVAPYFRAR